MTEPTDPRHEARLETLLRISKITQRDVCR